jgi:hypothetical protein
MAETKLLESSEAGKPEGFKGRGWEGNKIRSWEKNRYFFLSPLTFSTQST